MWPSCARLAHPDTTIPFDWMEGEASVLLSAVVESLGYSMANIWLPDLLVSELISCSLEFFGEALC